MPLPCAAGSDTIAHGERKSTRREQEILDHVLRGFANKDIAAQLSISVFTVKNHLRHIYEKLPVRSRTDVLLKYRAVRSEADGRPGPR